MKRKFLIWSAVLTVVFSAAVLQSCSADDDTFATEEYGYYTEAENEMVRALAEKYGLCVEINEEYYGSKRSIVEIEEEMKALSSLLGEHKLELSKKEDDKLVFTEDKGNTHIARISTRAIEEPGTWSDFKKEDSFTITVSISWNGDGTLEGQSASGDVSILYTSTDPSESTFNDYSSGYITCKITGNDGIDFSGWVSYSKAEKHGQYTTYRFSIEAGYVSTTTPAKGNFIVTGGKPSGFL